MKRLKLISLISAVALVALVLLGFYISSLSPDAAEETESTKVVGTEGDGGDEQEAKEEKKATEPAPAADVSEPNESAEVLEAINLDNVEMKAIIGKLYDWTEKPIIPTSDAVMEVKVTIHSGKAVTRARALSLIYDALRVRGVVVEHAGDRIFLKPIAEAKLGSVPTLGPDEPLARQLDRSRIVEKFFHIENYSPTKVVMAVSPFVNEYGHITGIESSGLVSVIDTVENLMRIERIIKELDVPESEQFVEEFFEIKHADPIELVGVLKLIFDVKGTKAGKRPSPQPPSSKGPKLATSVKIETSQITVKLIPIPKKNWIIARGSSEDIKKIGEWIKKLDTDDTVKPEQTIIAIRFADVLEVTRMVENAIAETPGTELKTSVIVQALPQSRQIVVFGSEDNRRFVEDIINEIDQPTSDMFEYETFLLKYADTDQIKEHIEELYEQQAGYQSIYRRGGYSRREVSPDDVVKVISYPARGKVTVIASAQNLEKIREQIKAWDVPLDVSKDQYRIITLNNSDPVKMVELLSTLFTEDDGGGRTIWDYLIGRDSGDKEKIVGNLYGMLTFEPVPDTKKIIVISKIPQAYDIIEKLIKELDSREKAEVPKVITLKYADAEDLCEQLNAILNEPGTQASIRRSKSGLTDYSTTEVETTSDSGESSSQSQDAMDFWWGRGSQNRRDEEMPTSNLIGKIRFIPVHRSKALLVLAPPEYLDDITDMIEILDKPGKQVMIKAVIVEIGHSDMTSLGIQLAADSSTFGTLEENALNVLYELANAESWGSLSLTTTANINVLVDLLVKKANARVLNQPTLWTKDNEEAVFMKGQEVPFVEGSQTDTTGTSIKEAVKYSDVGVTLRVRPNITPEKAVDMTIDLEISEVASDLVSGQIAIDKLNTTTHLIVNDGETVLLGGILFQKDSIIERKVPLLGDIPIIGGLFRHEESLMANSELLMFITPYVMDEESTDEAIRQIEEPKKRMQKIVRQMAELFMTEDDDDFADQTDAAEEENTD